MNKKRLLYNRRKLSYNGQRIGIHRTIFYGYYLPPNQEVGCRIYLYFAFAGISPKYLSRN